MAKKRRRRNRGLAPIDASGGPPPIIPPTIFNRTPYEPRSFTWPGAGFNAASGTPSCLAMGIVYTVIVGVIALCALGVILNVFHK